MKPALMSGSVENLHMELTLTTKCRVMVLKAEQEREEKGEKTANNS